MSIIFYSPIKVLTGVDSREGYPTPTNNTLQYILHLTMTMTVDFAHKE